MKSFMNISVGVLASAFALCSCSKWTEPQNLDFHRKTPEQLDPAAYGQQLSAVREYKKSAHKLMFATIQGTAEQPSRQNQHLMAMPDSLDFICVDMGDELHPSIASEIPEVREKKGTETLLCIDYAPISEAWGLLEDARSDAGQPAGTDEELVAFFREQTELQLARCNKYGFSGLQVSFIGNRATHYAELSQKTYIQAVKDFHEANPGLTIVFRGSARNVVDSEFLKEFSYIVVVAGEEKKLSSLVARLGDAPTDRIIMEVTVPSADNPVQVGRSAYEAAEWVVAESGNADFSPCGLGVSNACDDYFNKTAPFHNIRTAISKMNPAPAENEGEKETSDNQQTL